MDGRGWVGRISHTAVTAVTEWKFCATYTDYVVAELRKYAESAGGEAKWVPP